MWLSGPVSCLTQYGGVGVLRECGWGLCLRRLLHAILFSFPAGHMGEIVTSSPGRSIRLAGCENMQAVWDRQIESSQVWLSCMYLHPSFKHRCRNEVKTQRTFCVCNARCVTDTCFLLVHTERWPIDTWFTFVWRLESCCSVPRREASWVKNKRRISKGTRQGDTARQMAQYILVPAVKGRQTRIKK